MCSRRRLLFATVVLLAGAAFWWWGWPVVHVNRLVSSDAWPEASLSAREADRLHKILHASPLAQTGPAILRRLAKPPVAMHNGPRSWAASRVPDAERSYYAASKVWWEKTTDSRRKSDSAALPQLLLSARDTKERAVALHALVYAWSAEARPEVLRIARDESESIPTRAAALNMLLRKDDIASHLPLAFELIDFGVARGWTEHRGFRAPIPATQRRVRLFEIIFRDAPLPKAAPDTRARILLAGHQALLDLAETELRSGYFVAGSLGDIAGNPPGFAPEQKDYALGRTGGLSESFFTDSVKFALAWFAAHPEATATTTAAAATRASSPAL